MCRLGNHHTRTLLLGFSLWQTKSVPGHVQGEEKAMGSRKQPRDRETNREPGANAHVTTRLVGCGHAANGQPDDEERDQAVKEQRLPGMAIPHVGPNKRHNEHCCGAIEVMHRRCCPRTFRKQQNPEQDLDGNESLADDQRAGKTS
jgi:hypothetical protein